MYIVYITYNFVKCLIYPIFVCLFIPQNIEFPKKEENLLIFQFNKKELGKKNISVLLFLFIYEFYYK